MSQFDNVKYALECFNANNTLLYDELGLPSVMVRIPLLYLDDLIPGAAHTPHPAFIVAGVTKPYIYISKYTNIFKNSRAYSLPNQVHSMEIPFDAALQMCYQKGKGWHLMTNAEHALISLLSVASGVIARGNTNLGQSSEAPYERGVAASLIPYTGTGTGPSTWAHNHETSGIFDLVGNTAEYLSGARINDGEIQIIPNNDAAQWNVNQSATSTLWKAILKTGTLVTPKTANTLKYDYTRQILDTDFGINSLRINTTVEFRQVKEEQVSYVPFNDVEVKSGVTIPDILKHLALYPRENIDTGYRDIVMINNIGERILAKGGHYMHGVDAGLFQTQFVCKRTDVVSATGFRAAYVDL